MTYPKGYTPPIKLRDGTYPKGYAPPPNATIAPSQNDDRVEIRYVEDGNIKSAVIDPWSTGLYNGESLLWNYASNTKGIIR